MSAQFCVVIEEINVSALQQQVVKLRSLRFVGIRPWSDRRLASHWVCQNNIPTQGTTTPTQGTTTAGTNTPLRVQLVLVQLPHSGYYYCWYKYPTQGTTSAGTTTPTQGTTTAGTNTPLRVQLVLVHLPHSGYN